MSLDKDQYRPLVTVVIPTFNRLPYILEAVQSVMAQTHSNWELFVADDGSTDDTVAVLEAITDTRIRVIRYPHTGKVGPILNECAKKGSGHWICFLDSDDVWLPEKLERQLNILQESGLECCYTNYELMDEAGKTIPPKAGKFKPFSGKIIKELLLTETTITIVSVMLSRKLFDATGGFSSDPRIIYLDYEFELRMCGLVDMICLPEILLRVREHSGRTTNNISSADLHVNMALVYETFIAAKPAKELRKIAWKERGKQLRSAAKINFKEHKYRQAFRILKKILTRN